MKIIALDYDDTYTADPELFDQFISAAKDRGHLVVCVTYRHEHTPIKRDIGIEVFYTNGKPKAEHMREVGLSPDVWIDDWPELIGITRPC
jgi:hypothetical protein